ncbi:RNA polymerase sigma factor [Penaeicola halotolerans]|uniref:RNA polymerase sigma factor n=1 Tax=Penaeicola halotolerans TaxID=2793196 RepID=UPI001CF8F175|nr:sigma-70 family RNA polymerase sigma factor [Penaeicola halotolerans]
MNKYKPSDSELISQFRKGNEEAFALIVNKYKAKVFTSVYLIVKDKDVAEDLIQEVFIKVIKTVRSDRYNEEGKFQPWLMRIAHNLAIDHFRKNKRYPTIVLEDGSSLFDKVEFSEESYESVQIKNETHEKLRQLIDDLPETQKQVLIMRHYMDMSFQEIADQTGVSINTALGRMRYALINLRKKITHTSIAYDHNFYPK